MIDVQYTERPHILPTENSNMKHHINMKDFKNVYRSIVTHVKQYSNEN